MSTATPAIRTVTVERDLAFPPEKIWRALTESHLLEDWLMKNDFHLTSGHSFRFWGDWGGVDCQVQTVEPNKTLSYKWDAMGLESTVTWTLTPSDKGTLLRLEQSGFRPDQDYAYKGAQDAWPNYFTAMEKVLTGLA